MRGEVTFDTIDDGSERDHVEGCYRLPAAEWMIFYFTHRINGERWTGSPIIRKEVTFQSGAKGMDAVMPISTRLDNGNILRLLGEILGVEEWVIVRGPDSLQLK
jgi:hypothetical protein